MILCKYQTIDKLFWENYINSTFWFQNPRLFDDDFDSNIPLDTDYLDIDIEVLMRASYLFNFKTQIGFEDSVGRAVKEVCKSPESKKKFFNGFIDEHARERIGITCFSQDEFNRVLWANYTNKGSGVCFLFDTTTDCNFFKNLYPVDYVEKIPKLKIDFYNLPESLRKYFTFKHSDWRNQKEFRLFRHKMGLDKYNPISLREIVFGTRTSKVDINKVISIGLQLNPELEFYQLEMFEGEYKKRKI